MPAFTGIERGARLKLDRLEAATTLQDLAVLPGNRFETLKGNRKGQCNYSGVQAEGLRPKCKDYKCSRKARITPFNTFSVPTTVGSSRDEFLLRKKPNP